MAKITILQRGGNRHPVHHYRLKQAIQFMGREIMGARLWNTLAIRVELRATKLKKDTHGQVGFKRNGSKAQRKFTIVAQRDDDRRTQMKTLAHELVHVEQAARGRVQLRIWKTDGKVHARWEGKEIGILDEIKYADRPWEIEAYKLEKSLYLKWVRYHSDNYVKPHLDSVYVSLARKKK